MGENIDVSVQGGAYSRLRLFFWVFSVITNTDALDIDDQHKVYRQYPDLHVNIQIFTDRTERETSLVKLLILFTDSFLTIIS